MQWIGAALGAVMRLCYQWVQNYGLAVILFTILSKFILFPVSLWVHQNGIKMVRMQARINRIKIRHFGDGDAIAEEQGKLYKQERYNPFLGLVPIFVQLFLLIGLIQVIYHPLSYILRLPQDLCQAVVGAAHQLGGIDAASSSAELLALDYVQRATDLTAFAALPGMTQETLNAMLRMNMSFLGLHLSGVPAQAGGMLLLIPVLAGLASVILSLSQNVMNPLQREQGRAEQMGSMLFSVGLSLVLGFFIPAGVGFYWIWSNLFTIGQQAVLNLVYRPEKHIDYAELADSKKELAQYQSVGKAAGTRSKQDVQRERADYKRFFSIVNKHLVFYSEKSGFYKYYQEMIEYLLNHTNIIIHYVTSDSEDQIFELAKKHSQIRPYYIGEKRLITLMMKMDADIVVMTMPDLENYHIKRSYVRKDIEYIYVFHAAISGLRTLRPGALDHYDTILTVGSYIEKEIRETEKRKQLPAKKLVPCGYAVLDHMAKEYRAMEKRAHDVPRILIAPSWQADNILECCLKEMAEELLKNGYDVTVRPHPQYLRRSAVKLDAIMEACKGLNKERFHFELDFSSNVTVFTADLLITDWSSIGYEYALATEKPVLFVDTPMKVVNSEFAQWEKNWEPFDLKVRRSIGIALTPEEVKSQIGKSIENLLNNQDRFRQKIVEFRSENIYHFMESGKYAANYIIEQLQKKKHEKEERQ